MPVKTQPAKALWAIDPFPLEQAPLKKAREALAAWERSHSSSIQPVSVVTPPADPRWAAEFWERWSREFSNVASEAARPLRKDVPARRMLKPDILVHAEPSKTTAVEDLVSYAEKSRAEIIVVSTHVKKGIGRFRLGGFTQALIERSTVPVLAVRPDSVVPRTFSKVLFLTDFSKDSEHHFRKLLDLAGPGTQIILFHRLDAPELPMVEYPVTFGDTEFLTQMAREAERGRRATAAAWEKIAAKKGIEVDLIFSRQLEALSRGALRAIRRKGVDLVALVVRPHPVTRILLGSAVTELLQASPKPVLVLPTK